MKGLKTPLLIGAAAIAAIGLAGAAVAEIKHSHVMQVRLPDGTLEEIRYTGDTPPVARLQPGWAPVAYAWPEDTFGAESCPAGQRQVLARVVGGGIAVQALARGLASRLRAALRTQAQVSSSSSTSRTRFASWSKVNGFCRRRTPASSRPWCTMALRE